MYGLFFTSFGLYVVLIYLIKRFALSLETASVGHLFIGIGLMFSAWPLMLSREPLSDALLESAILRPLLLNVAGIPENSWKTGASLGADETMSGSFSVCWSVR